MLERRARTNGDDAGICYAGAMQRPTRRAIGAAAAAAYAALSGCADLTYDWDDRRVLCSTVVDDISDSTPWRLVEDGMIEAEALRSVLLLHAHAPGVTISIGAIAGSTRTSPTRSCRRSRG